MASFRELRHCSNDLLSRGSLWRSFVMFCKKREEKGDRRLLDEHVWLASFTQTIHAHTPPSSLTSNVPIVGPISPVHMYVTSSPQDCRKAIDRNVTQIHIADGLRLHTQKCRGARPDIPRIAF